MREARLIKLTDINNSKLNEENPSYKPTVFIKDNYSEDLT